MAQTPIREMTQKFNRKRIIQKCKELFFEKNLADVKSDDISAFCGYSKRTIYAYFTSKEDILSNIQEHCFEDFFSELMKRELSSFSDFIDFVYSYKHIHKEDFFFISQKEFNKDNEDDYFFFSKNFKPMIDILVCQHDYIYTSIDIPLLIWNSIVYGIKNNITPDTLLQFIIK